MCESSKNSPLAIGQSRTMGYSSVTPVTWLFQFVPPATICQRPAFCSASIAWIAPPSCSWSERMSSRLRSWLTAPAPRRPSWVRACGVTVTRFEPS